MKLRLLLHLRNEQKLNHGIFVGGLWAVIDLATYVADFDGIRASFGCAGAAGLKPCLLCQNVLSRGNKSAVGEFVTISCADVAKFQLVSQTELENFVDSTLRGPARTKAALKELQTVSGVTLDGTTLLANAGARAILPYRKVLFDSGHLYWSNGIVSLELILFANRMQEKTRYRLQDLANLASDFSWEPCYERRKHGVTNWFRKRLFHAGFWEGAMYKGSATQTLLLFPLFLYLADRALSNEQRMQDELRCLWALHRCVQVLFQLQMDSRNSGGPPSNNFRAITRQLQVAQQDHQKLVNLVYGEAVVRPKHHYRFHLSSQYDEHGYCDCFPMEAKHRDYKAKVADPMAHMLKEKDGKFSQGALTSMLMATLSSVKDAGGWELLGPMQRQADVPELAGLPNCEVSANCRVGPKLYGSGNVLARSDGSLIMRKHCVDQAGQLSWILSYLRVQRKKGCFYTCSEEGRAVTQVSPCDCFHRAAWKLAQADHVIVLLC